MKSNCIYSSYFHCFIAENPQAVTISPPAVLDAEQVQQEVNLACNFDKGKSKVAEESDILERYINVNLVL